MSSSALADTAKALVADGKGILAADESSPTIKKRFDSIKIASTEENRRDYRDMLFTTPDAGKYISGVILYDETIRQKAADGTSLVKKLTKAGMIPGIKVDMGAKPLAAHPGETVTEGLDGLRARLEEYADLGARFTKWRGVYRIDEGMPSPGCVTANAHALARYAAMAQEAGLVPIVEPEILMDGDHDIDVCEEVTEEVLRSVYNELVLQNVWLEGTLLKPNMVISGQDCPEQAGGEEVAERTVRCLKRTVPAAVPGIVFLSGGQSDDLATEHLNAMNKLPGTLPWKLSFSYGRALQAAPLKAWAGKPENLDKSQAAFLKRARDNAAAATGSYAA
ncbi:MAG: class I fructose-bisphosphate aldolase [Kiloniellaceae bacterium]